MCGTTKFGVPIFVRRNKVGTSFVVHVGKGRLHPTLQGTFTSLHNAKIAVRGYMESVHYDLPEDPDFTNEG
jgi:hypothetical protein